MSTPTSPYAGDPKPNVIWFMVDQMRGQAMSIAGDPNLHTPNLDRMARDGAWLRGAVMGFPLCCPARGAMVTGLYPHRCVPGHQYPLDPSIPTVADAFNAAGYRTAWFGKWHLDGYHEGHRGRAAWHIVPRERRGRFATWVGYDNNNSQYDGWVHGHDGETEVPLRRLPGHETGALTDLLLAHVERHRDEPFFACVSVQPPHDPYIAPPEATARHNPATLALRPNVPPVARVEEIARRDLTGYYAKIEDIDRNVGRVLDRLAELGLDDRTYVVFLSDHGDQHGCHGHFQKMTPYEEAIRVPWLMWGGKRWQYRGRGDVDLIPNHVDLLPTTLGLARLPVPEGLPGHDYSWVAREPPGGRARQQIEAAPAEAYLQSVIPTQHAPSVDLPWRGIVTRDGWKYVALEGQPYLLFNLNEDPYELANLAHHAHARVKRRELNERLRAWIERTGDTFRLPDFAENGSPAVTQAAQETWPQPPSS